MLLYLKAVCRYQIIMSATRAKLTSLRAKLHSVRGKFSKLFHRRQPQAESEPESTQTDLAPTATVPEPEPESTQTDVTTCESDVPNDFSANLETATTAITLWDPVSSPMEKVVTDDVTSPNPPVATPRIKVRLFPKNLEHRTFALKEQNNIAHPTSTASNASSDCYIQIDQQFANHLSAITAFAEVEIVVPSFCPQPKTSSTATATATGVSVATSTETFTSTNAKEMHSLAVETPLLEPSLTALPQSTSTTGLEQTVRGDLHLPALCASYALHGPTLTRSPRRRRNTKASEQRLLDEREQLRQCIRANGLMV